MIRRTVTYFIPVVLMAACAALARGEESAAPTGEEIRLTVHPAATGEPAMRDALLPPVAEQVRGNAATVYLMAFAEAGAVASDPAFETLQGAKPADMNEAQAVSLLTAHASLLRALSVAGRRSGCDWDPPTREQGLAAQLPYLNAARLAGNLESIRVRLAIRRRDFADAIEGLRDGFALAEHLEREPLVVHALVAAAIRSTMLADARELAQCPGAPNLFWPLANLPPAGRDRVAVVQAEEASLLLTFPELRDVDRLSAEQSRRILAEIQRLAGNGQSWAELILEMVRAYPSAREYLVANGTSRDYVTRMPANTVVLAYYVGQYAARSEAVNKWAGLPLWQALARAPQSTLAAPVLPAGDGPALHSYGSAAGEGPVASNPLLGALPAFGRVFGTLARVEQERAMLEIVEGIRAYAAAHGGAAPPSLDALSTDTPAPLDPATNRPFDYRVEGDGATLAVAAPPGQPPQAAKTWHISIVH